MLASQEELIQNQSRPYAARQGAHCMIEITNSEGYILAFDGRIIEIFTRSDNMRIHINHVEAAEVDENKKGLLWIKIKTRHKVANLPDIHGEKRTAVNELISRINEARSDKA